MDDLKKAYEDRVKEINDLLSDIANDFDKILFRVVLL